MKDLDESPKLFRTFQSPNKLQGSQLYIFEQDCPDLCPLLENLLLATYFLGDDGNPRRCSRDAVPLSLHLCLSRFLEAATLGVTRYASSGAKITGPLSTGHRQRERPFLPLFFFSFGSPSARPAVSSRVIIPRDSRENTCRPPFHRPARLSVSLSRSPLPVSGDRRGPPRI